MFAILDNLRPGLPTRPRDPARFLRFLCGARRAVGRWLEVRRQLRALSELDDHHLRDIGLSREDVARACSTSFWTRRRRPGRADQRGLRPNSSATCSPRTIRFRRDEYDRAGAVGLLCGLLTALPATHAEGREICRPILSTRASGHSEVVNLQRRWTGVFAVDASRCATATGSFEIEFVRLKEVGPDLAFTEPFTWRAERMEASLDLTWDEWVSSYRIQEVAPCPCRH
jgi:uncharacterized protein YjiS (DUF1127 family)